MSNWRELIAPFATGIAAGIANDALGYGADQWQWWVVMGVAIVGYSLGVLQVKTYASRYR